MALKAKLTKEEHAALPDAVKALYVEKDGTFVLDVDDVDNFPQVGGLKSALDKEREEVKKAKKEHQETIDKYKDIDPEKARQAQEELQKLNDKKLLDEGKVEELLKARTERMKADYETKIAAFNAKIGGLEKQVSASEGRLSEVLIDNALRTAAVKAKVRPAAVDDVILRGQRIWGLKNGAPIPMKGDQVLYGKDPNQAMTMDEWIGGLATEAPHLFEPSSGGGTTNQNAGNSGGKTIHLSREEAKDPAKYRAARDKAVKEGLEFSIAQE